MLIISQPGTVALEYAIAENGYVSIPETIRKENYNVLVEGYNQIQKLYTTAFDYDAKVIYDMATTRQYIYNVHLLPTERHVSIINKIGENVLFLFCNSGNEALKSFDEEKHTKIYEFGYDMRLLEEELDMFMDKWVYYYYSCYKNITYQRDLEEKYQKAMDDIFDHFGLRKRKFYNEYNKKTFVINGIKYKLAKKR